VGGEGGSGRSHHEMVGQGGMGSKGGRSHSKLWRDSFTEVDTQFRRESDIAHRRLQERLQEPTN